MTTPTTRHVFLMEAFALHGLQLPSSIWHHEITPFFLPRPESFQPQRDAMWSYLCWVLNTPPRDIRFMVARSAHSLQCTIPYLQRATAMGWPIARMGRERPHILAIAVRDIRGWTRLLQHPVSPSFVQWRTKSSKVLHQLQSFSLQPLIDGWMGRNTTELQHCPHPFVSASLEYQTRRPCLGNVWKELWRACPNGCLAPMYPQLADCIARYWPGRLLFLLVRLKRYSRAFLLRARGQGWPAGRGRVRRSGEDRIGSRLHLYARIWGRLQPSFVLFYEQRMKMLRKLRVEICTAK
jgi:hypothetical protein